MLPSPAGHATSMGGKAGPKGAIRAKIQFCTECHGLSGRVYARIHHSPACRAAGPVSRKPVHRSCRAQPRQSGCQAVHGARCRKRCTRDQDRHRRYFARRSSQTTGGGPKKPRGPGEADILREGFPDGTCPPARPAMARMARAAISFAPVAGQIYAYTVGQLERLGQGLPRQGPGDARDPNTMQAIATSMTKEQIAAVAGLSQPLGVVINKGFGSVRRDKQALQNWH